ncbi:MAG TPA: hypothetical protein VJA21_28815 [Verrucomicrobiae bacterium]
MLIIETLLELGALGILGGFLWKRHLARIGRPLNDRGRIGVALDTAPLRPRIESVRRDYTTAFGPRPKDANSKPKLVSMARSLVRQLGYFHDRTPEVQPGSAVGHDT